MSRNRMPWRTIKGLAWAGMVLALYDYLSRLLGLPLFCPFAGDGCDIVQNSPYAVLFGIPLALMGVFGFGAYLALAHLGARSSPGLRWPLTRYGGLPGAMTCPSSAAPCRAGMSFLSNWG